MNLGQLIKVVRGDLSDLVGSDKQRNWQDWQLAEYASRACREICKELFPLQADDDVAETTATGTITLTGSAGQIDSVKVNGLTVTSAAVSFSVDLATTATALAANITAFAANIANTNPIKFTATASSNVVTITAPAGTGTTPNTYAVLPAVSGGLSFTATTMTGGACLCRLYLIPGQTRYYIDSRIAKIIRFKPESMSHPVYPTTKKTLDRTGGDWQNLDPGEPSAYIPDYRNSKITVVPAPLVADTVDLDVARFPTADFDTSVMSAEPEFSRDYQDPIIPWMKREAFLKNDVETLDMNRSQKFEAEFYRMIEQIKVKLDIGEEPIARGVSHPGMY